MTVAAVLLVYAAGVGTVGARVLAQANWTGRAPLLAILTYLAAAWSVLLALALAGLTLAVHATALGGALSQLIGACVLRLRATYATPGGAAVAGAGLVLTGMVATRTALTAASHLRITRRQALRHARTARLVGRPQPALGAVLVEHSQAAAYCVAGRHPTVILTTGALQALAPGQLDAVLAHERAHLAWRHHRLLAMARIGRRVLPFLPLMRDADAQVERLVELHADDAATQARDPDSLATALVVLATAASDPAVVPDPASVPGSAVVPDPASVPGSAVVPDPVVVPGSAVVPDPAAMPGSAAVPGSAVVPDPAAMPGSAAVPGSAPVPTPSTTPVLASAATDAVHRIHRLLRPAEPLGGPRRLLLQAIAAALVLGPLIMALAPAVLALALGRVPHT